jgi:uncharacterized membrane protein YbhN (UPF0104 family)
MNKKNVAIVAAGLGLFAFVAAKMGWRGMLDELKTVWIMLPVLAGLSTVRLLLQTVAWSSALKANGVHAGFAELMGARTSSHGMGYLSVFGPLVSEPMRISLLSDHEAVTAPTLIDSGVSWFGSGVITIVGCLCAAESMGVQHHTKSLVALALVTVIGMLLVLRSKPLLPLLVRKLGSRTPSWLRQGEEVEVAIYDFRQKHPRTLHKMFWLGMACQMLTAAEVVAVFCCLKMPVHAGMILALEAANRVVKAMGGWLPARLGTDESGMAAAFMAFGLPSASGLALALARRSRDLLEVLVGFAWLAGRSRLRSAAAPLQPMPVI